MAPRIDSHQHFWTLDRGDYDWLTPELGPLYRDFGPDDLRPLMRVAGMERSVLVQAAPTQAETRFLLELARESDLIAAVVGWLDLERPDAPDVLATLAREPLLRGVRPMIQDIPDPDWMLRPELKPAFEALTALGLRLDALVRPEHLPRLLALLEQHPGLRVVIDHGAKPQIAQGVFEPWAEQIARIARGTSACCKLSGLVTEASPETAHTIERYADWLLECFGPERIMWGSDWPVVELAGGYEDWWARTGGLLESLTPAQRAAVLGGTAADFYGL